MAIRPYYRLRLAVVFDKGVSVSGEPLRLGRVQKRLTKAREEDARDGCFGGRSVNTEQQGARSPIRDSLHRLQGGRILGRTKRQRCQNCFARKTVLTPFLNLNSGSSGDTRNSSADGRSLHHSARPSYSMQPQSTPQRHAAVPAAAKRGSCFSVDSAGGRVLATAAIGGYNVADGS